MMDGTSTMGETATAWFDAQRKLLEQWSSMVAPTAAGNPLPDQGQQAVDDAIEMLHAASEPAATVVLEQMAVGQAALLKLMHLTTDAWQAMSTQLGSGESWQEALRQYTDQLRDTLTEASQKALDATQNTQQVWQTYLEQSQRWILPWLNAAGSMLEPQSQLAAGDTSALSTLTSAPWDAYHETFGRLINTPTFGATREINERQVAAFNAWVELVKANSEYQIVLADISTKAFNQFMETLVHKAQRGETIPSTREFTNLWTDVAEAVFGNEFRSPTYVEAQGKLLNSSMAFQLRQRDLMERAARAAGMPTKSEMDEAHKSIYALRKEVKALKKAQQAHSDDGPNGTRTTLKTVEDAHAEVDNIQRSVRELQASQPELEALLESLDDLRKQVKKLRKALKDQDVSDEDASKKRGKKHKDS